MGDALEVSATWEGGYAAAVAGARPPASRSTSRSRLRRRRRRHDADRGAVRRARELLLPRASRTSPAATASSCPTCASTRAPSAPAASCATSAIVVTTAADVAGAGAGAARRRAPAGVCWVSNTLAEAAGGRVSIHGGPMSERLIVIGGGGAGTAAATIAKRLNPDLKVTLFTEFPDIAYSPCGIPFVHGREIAKFENLFLSTVERYIEDGLDMRMETTVTDIDLDRGTVTARNTHEGFDKLVVVHRLHLGEAGRARRQPRGPALRQGHPRRDAVRRGARRHEARRRDRRDPARRRDGRQPRPPRPAGRLRRRGSVGAVGGARPRRRRSRSTSRSRSAA